MRGSTAFGVVAVAAASRYPAGIAKVLELLETQKQKVIKTGETDASNYNEFSCFCKETGEKKRDDISAGNTKQSDLQSKIETARSDEEFERGEVAAFTEEIQDTNKHIAQVKDDKKETLSQLDMENLELKDAVTQIRNAIDRLRASDKQDGAFLQLLSKVEPYGVALAPQKFTALMQAVQQDPLTVPRETYKFRSDKIIGILEDLHKDFKENHDDNLKLREKKRSAFDADLDSLYQYLKIAKADLKKAEENVARLQKELGEFNAELSVVEMGLQDNTEYLRNLVDRCDETKAEWDFKEKTRLQELTALGTAVEIIKKSFDTGAALVQEDDKDSLEPVTNFVQIRKVMSSVESALQSESQEVAAETSYKKATRGGRFRLASRDPRDRIVEILERAADQTHSTALAALATSAGGDPFVKIRALITQLINRLQKEASEQQDHHQYCTKAIAKQEEVRDRKSGEIKDLNAALAAGDALRERLNENFADISAEVSEINEAWNTAEKLYNQQKKDNGETIDEASMGIEAVRKATEVLQEFYGAERFQTERKEKATAVEGEPGQGFTYGLGEDSKDAAGGIFSMLEVITGDFEASIRETEKLQKEQTKEHEALRQESTRSLTKKKGMYDEYMTQWSEGRKEYADNRSAFEAATASRDSAVKELTSLAGECTAQTDSYEERKQKREDEMAALTEAMKILDEYRD